MLSTKKLLLAMLRIIMKENEGSSTFRVDWQVVEGNLVATRKGKTLMVLTPLSAAQ